MRVLLAAVRYAPAPGGAETHVRALAEGLAARGHHVEVAASDLFKEVPFTRRPDLPREVAGVPVHRFPAWSPGGEAHYVFQRGLTRHLLRRGGEFDVLHAHSYGYHQTWACAAASAITQTPFVLTPHYHPPWSMEGGARRGLLRRVYDASLGRATLARAHAVLGVSRAELGLMRPLGLREARARVVPNGIHLDRFTPPPDPQPFRDAYDLEGPVVLYAGRLAVNKGLHHLVEATPRILASHPEATVVIAGEDQDQGPRLAARARELGVADRVLMTGHLSEALLLSAFSAADAFVLPSEYEAFGIVLLEAMACETPVVATRRGGAPEVVGVPGGGDGVEVGEAGLVVPYGDAAALAEAVARLLAEPALAREMGKRGRARVAREFTWDAVVDRVEAVYHDVLS